MNKYFLDVRPHKRFKLSDNFVDTFDQSESPMNEMGTLIFKRTYARPTEDGTLETWFQCCKRVVEGVFNTQKRHCKDLHLPWDDRKAQRTAQDMFTRMYEMKWTPPGRGLWAMGTSIMDKKGSAALNNCGFCSTKDLSTDFSGPFCFLMDMSMLGVGIGADTKGAGKVSIVQPEVNKEQVYSIEDSREGWVDSLRITLDAYVGKGFIPTFDYSLIRKKGEPLKNFGGKASGPEPLREMIEEVQVILDRCVGEKIDSTAIVDIFNVVGRCVVAGGIRRSAEIMFGEPEDDVFPTLKNRDEVDSWYTKQYELRMELQKIYATSFDGVDMSVQKEVDAVFTEIISDYLQDPDLYSQHNQDVMDAYLDITEKIEGHPITKYRWASNNSILAEKGMDYSKYVDQIASSGEPGFIWLENIRKYGRMVDEPNNKDIRVMGCNPCVTADTLVMTSNGLSSVSSLIGEKFDAVVETGLYSSTDDGFFFTGTKPIYRLKLDNGMSVKLTEDHKVLTCPKLTAKKRYESWIEAGDLSEGDLVVLGNNHGFEWEGKGTYESGWLVGCLMGDGYFNNGVANLQFWDDKSPNGSEKAKLMLETAKTFLDKVFGDNRSRTGSFNSDRGCYSTSSVDLVKYCESIDIDSQKNFLSSDILTSSSSSFLKGFISGMFDTDGSFVGNLEKGISIRLSSVRIQHLEFVQQMLSALGINSKIYLDRKDSCTKSMPNGEGGYSDYPCKSLHELIISKDNIRKYIELIGTKNIRHKVWITGVIGEMKRSFNRDRFVSKVVSVEYVGIEKVYDCTINEVHRFSANGITVHNCGEQSLEDRELCCLVETFPANHTDINDYLKTLKVAYLYAKSVTLVPTHDERTNAVLMRNRRIGCSMSGIIQASEKFGVATFREMCTAGYEKIQEFDETYSEWLCVPRSRKTTSVKPSGTVSLLAGSTPGIHYDHAEFYIRNVRVRASSPLVIACERAGYKVEKCLYTPDTMVISFPVKAKNFSKSKSDVTIWEQFANAAFMQKYWSDNQVSITVSFSEEEKKDIVSCLEMYEDQLKSISLLPRKDKTVYPQSPYITITEEEYIEMSSVLKKIDFENAVHEETEKFCDGDSCVL